MSTTPEINYEERVKAAIEAVFDWGGFDGAHHKQYAIDQVLRALTGCPANDAHGYAYYGKNDEYRQKIADFCDGVDGPNTYKWDEGVAP